MLEPKRTGTNKDINIHINFARNGVVVRGDRYDNNNEVGMNSCEYVYSSLEEALAEIPSIYSALEQGKEVVNEDTLKEEEQVINKSSQEEKENAY